MRDFLEPDVQGRRAVAVAPVHVIPHARRPLGQHLEGVPARLLHGVEDLVDIGERHVLVEQVAHGIHEDHLRRADGERLFQAMRAQGQVEAFLIGMARHAPEPLREPLRIAVVAARADLRAARHRVPRQVRPFDL